MIVAIIKLQLLLILVEQVRAQVSLCVPLINTSEKVIVLLRCKEMDQMRLTLKYPISIC